MYFYARSKVKSVLNQIPGKIDITIKQTATGFQFIASGGFDIEPDQRHPRVDQALGQRRAHQAQPDDSNRRIGVHVTALRGYCASMPAALASAVHRTISLRIKPANSSGRIGATITPTLASFSRVAGSDRNLALSA